MDIIDMKFVTKQMVEDLLARADFKVKGQFELEYVKNKTRSAVEKKFFTGVFVCGYCQDTGKILEDHDGRSGYSTCNYCKTQLLHNPT